MERQLSNVPKPARERLGIPDDKLVLLHYGIGTRRKGLHLVIQTMLSSTRPEGWHLLYAGQLADDRGDYRRFADLVGRRTGDGTGPLRVRGRRGDLFCRRPILSCSPMWRISVPAASSPCRQRRARWWSPPTTASSAAACANITWAFASTPAAALELAHTLAAAEDGAEHR
jgi:hypothetical protein